MRKTFLTMIALLFVSLTLAGCANTAVGVGRDVRHNAHVVERSFK